MSFNPLKQKGCKKNTEYGTIEQTSDDVHSFNKIVEQGSNKGKSDSQCPKQEGK